jgi:hypothetical protein
MLEDSWVAVVALLSFVLGLLVRGELSRVFNRKKDQNE